MIGEEVKLRQVCRWVDADKAAFEPMADLVLMRLARQSPFKTLTRDATSGTRCTTRA